MTEIPNSTAERPLVRESSPRQWRLLAWSIAAIQLLSAAIFALTVNKQVFDEYFCEPDVRLYEQRGVSVSSLRDHLSVAGPGMPILASLGGRLFPGLQAARRLPIFGTWIAIALLLRALMRQRPQDTAVPMAAAFLFAFPHTPLAMATLLTEGPALACVLASLWASEFVRPSEDGYIQPLWRPLLAGLFLGLSLWFRQYYLAAIPAFVLVYARRRLWKHLLLFSIGPAVALLGYFLLWGGLTSARARSGSVYGGNRHADVGLNLARPISALFYIGTYAFVLQPWLRARRLTVWLLAISAGLAAIVLATGQPILGNGPLMAVIEGVRRLLSPAATVLTFMVMTAAFATCGMLLWLVWHRRGGPTSDFTVLLGSILLFFALEQFGISGNIPYYERYALQTVFFGTAFSATLASCRVATVAGFLALTVAAGQWILWRGR